jgi:xanthine dehydrogenase accessory factor
MTRPLAAAGQWRAIADYLARCGRLALVTVIETQGSTPREAGAAMIVLPDGSFSGTIGGGTLEWQALGAAQAALARAGRGISFRDIALGPALGQCCGGRLGLAIEILDLGDSELVAALAEREAAGPLVTHLHPSGDGRWARHIADPEAAALLGDAALRRMPGGGVLQRFADERVPTYIFGAGHVGRALVLALAPLPFRMVWIDPRPEAFPERFPGSVDMLQPAFPASVLDAAPAGSFVLVMTHSHALDLDIIAHALTLAHFPYLGLIGSATKRARFLKRLREVGLGAAAERDLVCPIGLASIQSKLPAAIAAGVAADLLIRRERLAAALIQREGERAHG